ncbi:hypothetical protein V6Z11_D05G210700 [Gossypium hirsutum]
MSCKSHCRERKGEGDQGVTRENLRLVEIQCSVQHPE